MLLALLISLSLLSILGVMALTHAGSSHASPLFEKSWSFERFDVDIVVNEDSSFAVTETQVVNFQGSFSFLTRDISTEPAFYYEGRTYGRVRIKNIQVYDLNGRPYDDELWSTEDYDGGVTVRIDFQAQDEQRGWIIEYFVTGAIIFDEDYDRLYYDAVSEYRDVPIRFSNINVLLPPDTDMNQVETAFYINPDNPPSAYDNGRDGDVLWWSAAHIPPYTTITIDVAFPKGVVEKPWQYRTSTLLIVLAASLGLILIALAVMLMLWWHKGRDRSKASSTQVRYEPPEGLTPALMSVLVHEKADTEDISATIVDLACKGKLSIFETEAPSLIFENKQFGFTREDPNTDGLLLYERDILNYLFTSSESTFETRLRRTFPYHTKDLLANIKDTIIRRGYFIGDPQRIKRTFYIIAASIALLLPACVLTFNIWYDLAYLNILAPAFLLVGVVIALIGRFMPRRSRVGTRAYEEALGFKEYLKTAEGPELDSSSMERFHRYLPYAMVLGVTKEWARRFEGIAAQPPAWFEGYPGQYNSIFLASTLDNMTHSLSTSLKTPPSEPSSGGGFTGSGFGGGFSGGFGGGFSGGGFGGGGSSAG
jgi:uncharacterized membrane protein YgcG